MTTFLDYSVEELQGMNYRDITHPEDFAHDSKELPALLRAAIPSLHRETRFIDRAGRIRWGSLHVTLERGTDGTAKHLIAQIQNITEEKEIDQTKRDFVATISHELRTPLTSIHGAIRLIRGLDKGELSDAQRKLLDTASTNSDRLISLVNDILDLEKLNAGEIQSDLQLRDIRDQLRQAVAANGPYAQQFGVKFLLELPADPTMARIDDQQFAQIMSNLMSNAAKFSPPGGTVRIELRRAAESLEIHVIDSGPGVPPSFQSKVFDRFTQADGTAKRKKGGTGLGLHISRLLAEAMGGQLDFDRDLSSGADFYLILPIVE